MVIDIYINNAFYKRKDLGPVDRYDLKAITAELKQDHTTGVLQHGNGYQLSIQVIDPA
jgi:hypothetical protein